jgi:hypothetical protein
MARKAPLSARPRGARNKAESGPAEPRLESAMREVHNKIPSTVKRAKKFGPGGKEAMLEAIAFKKAGEKRKK